MKRMLALALLLISPSLGYEVVRENTHVLDSNLTDHYSFTEEYSNYSSVWTAFRLFREEFVQSRAPEMSISEWFFERNLSRIRLGAEGVLPGYAVQQENGLIKLGGKGFVDEYCENPSGAIGPIEQEIVSRIIIPPGYSLETAPKNYSVTSPHMSLSYTAVAQGNVLNERIVLKVNENIPGSMYCLERGDLEKPLKQGWTIKREGEEKYMERLFVLVSVIPAVFGAVMLLGVILILRRSKK